MSAHVTRMEKRKIPRSTLCCIDCQLPDLALQALVHSMALCTFEHVLFFTDRDMGVPGVECIRIATLASSADYSAFVLHRLADYIETDFVLLIQWDGFVLNPAAWRDDFLDVDYIGAVWPHRPSGMRVGNGGFSLRSKKLLKLAQRIDLFNPNFSVLNNGEDELLCLGYRDTLENDFGIRYASEDMAQAFSFERTPAATLPFGFHGLFNFWVLMPPQQVTALIDMLPDAIVLGHQFLHLGVTYVNVRQFALARVVLTRILQLEPGHSEARKYAAQLSQREPAPNVSHNDACPCGSGLLYNACCGKDVTSADPARALDLRWMHGFAQRLRAEGKPAYAEAVLRLLLNERPEHASARRDLEEWIRQRT